MKQEPAESPLVQSNRTFSECSPFSKGGEDVKIGSRSLFSRDSGGLKRTPIQFHGQWGNAGTSLTNVDGCDLRPEAKAKRAQALPVRADARALVPLQFGLRRLREDTVSGAHLEKGIVTRGVLQGRGGMRHADGVHPWRRASDALGDRQDCGGARGAEEVYLSLHQCPAAQRKTASFQAQQVPDLFRACGRARRAS